MADIFLKSQAHSLLKGKFVLMMGDSNMRSLYKDLLYLLHNNDITPVEVFHRTPPKTRWHSFEGDKVLDLSELNVAGRNYFEEREFKDEDIHIRYHFITRLLGAETESTLNAIQYKTMPFPDVVIVNSCIWDLTRWGAIQEEKYKEDIIMFFSKVRVLLPDDSLIIWNSTLPVSVNYTKGGLLIKQLEFVKYSLRFMVMEANKFTQQVCIAMGIDFLDLHYHMRFQLHRRSIDGLHWEPQAFRHLVCLILTHISLAFDIPLPGRIRSNYIKKCVDNATVEKEIDMKSICFEKDIEKIVKKEVEKVSNRKKVQRPKISAKNPEDKPTEQNRVKLKAKRKKSPPPHRSNLCNKGGNEFGASKNSGLSTSQGIFTASWHSRNQSSTNQVHFNNQGHTSYQAPSCSWNASYSNHNGLFDNRSRDRSTNRNPSQSFASSFQSTLTGACQMLMRQSMPSRNSSRPHLENPPSFAQNYGSRTLLQSQSHVSNPFSTNDSITNTAHRFVQDLIPLRGISLVDYFNLDNQRPNTGNSYGSQNYF